MNIKNISQKTIFLFFLIASISNESFTMDENTKQNDLNNHTNGSYLYNKLVYKDTDTTVTNNEKINFYSEKYQGSNKALKVTTFKTNPFNNVTQLDIKNVKNSTKKTNEEKQRSHKYEIEKNKLKTKSYINKIFTTTMNKNIGSEFKENFKTITRISRKKENKNYIELIKKSPLKKNLKRIMAISQKKRRRKKDTNKTHPNVKKEEQDEESKKYHTLKDLKKIKKYSKKEDSKEIIQCLVNIIIRESTLSLSKTIKTKKIKLFNFFKVKTENSKSSPKEDLEKIINTLKNIQLETTSPNIKKKSSIYYIKKIQQLNEKTLNLNDKINILKNEKISSKKDIIWTLNFNKEALKYYLKKILEKEPTYACNYINYFNILGFSKEFISLRFKNFTKKLNPRIFIKNSFNKIFRKNTTVVEEPTEESIIKSINKAIQKTLFESSIHNLTNTCTEKNQILLIKSKPPYDQHIKLFSMVEFHDDNDDDDDNYAVIKYFISFTDPDKPFEKNKNSKKYYKMLKNHIFEKYENINSVHIHPNTVRTVGETKYKTNKVHITTREHYNKHHNILNV